MGGYNMTNLLNEEIMAIKHMMAHLEKAIPLEVDYGKKQRLKQMYNECQAELEERLNRCEDYKG